MASAGYSGTPLARKDRIRDAILHAGDLVDVKVCAVDSVWSDLKLMVRRERR